MPDGPHAPKSFSRSPVPDDATVGSGRIALVLIGVAIALPAFLTGAELGRGFGFQGTLLATFAGGALLAAVASLTGVVGARSRLTTYMIILFSFGRRGGLLVNAVLAVSLLGWFGVLAVMFAQAAFNTMGSLSVSGIGVTPWTLAGSVLMTISAIYGFRALDRLSIIVTPAKALLLAVAVYAALRDHGSAALWTAPTGGMSFGVGMSIVAGGLMVGAVLMPDLCRYARTGRNAALAAIMGYGIGFPLVLVAASVPAILTGEPDLVKLMILLGLGVPALLTVLLATWTTNTYNLYSGSLVLSTIFPNIAYSHLALTAGAVGTLIAYLGIADHVVPYLIALSIAIPPIAGIYIAEFFVGRRGRFDVATLESEPAVRADAFLAWGAGIATAILGKGTYTFTSVPALDSLMAALGAYLVVRLLGRRLFPATLLGAARAPE